LIGYSAVLGGRGREGGIRYLLRVLARWEVAMSHLGASLAAGIMSVNENVTGESTVVWWALIVAAGRFGRCE